MPKLKNTTELLQASADAQRAIAERRAARTTIYIGMGTCGIAAGARDTMDAIVRELARLGIEADIEGVGCIGICVKEPLVDIQQPGRPRVSYGNVTPEMAPRIIEDHLIKDTPVKRWVVGRVPENY